MFRKEIKLNKLTLHATESGAGVMVCKATKIPKAVPEEVARAAANSLATSSTILFAKVDGNATTEGYEGNQSSVTIDGDRYVFFDPLSKKPFNIVSEDGTNTQVNVNFSSDDIVMNADPDTYNIRNYVTTIPYNGQSLDNADQWYTIEDQTGKTFTFRGAFPGLKITKLIRNIKYNGSSSYSYTDPDSGKDYLFKSSQLFWFILERVDNTQPYYADADFNQPIGYLSNKSMNGFIQIIYNEADFTNGVPDYLLNELNQNIPSFGFDGFVFTFATALFGKKPDGSGNNSSSIGVVSAKFDPVEGLTYHDSENFACARLGVSPGSFECINVGDSFTLSSNERKAFKIPTSKTGYYIVPTSLPIDAMIGDYVGCNYVTVTEAMSDNDYCTRKSSAKIDSTRNVINISGHSVVGYEYLVVNNFNDSSIDMTLTDVAPSYMESSKAYKAAIYAAVSNISSYTCCLPSEINSSYKDSFALDDAVTTFSSSQRLRVYDSIYEYKYSTVELTNVKSNIVMKDCSNYLVVVSHTDDGNYVATKVQNYDYVNKICILELTDEEIANGRIFIVGQDDIKKSTTITQMSAEQKEIYYQRKAIIEAGINFDNSDASAILDYMKTAAQFSTDPISLEDTFYFDTYNDCSAAGSTCLLDSDTALARVVNPDTVFREENTDGTLYGSKSSIYVILLAKNSSGNCVLSKQISPSPCDDNGSSAAEGKLTPFIYNYVGENVEQVTIVRRRSSSYNLRVTVPAQ